MITGFFGLPGSGKSTFLTMIAQKELKRIKKGKSKYKCVLTNYYCQGCYRLDFSALGKVLLEDSLVLIDEITLVADSRDFKQFSKSTKQFFLEHRKYGCDVIYFTQHYDNVDKKIRDVSYDLFFVRPLPLFSMFSYAFRIFRTLDIVEQTHDIVNGYRFPNLFDYIRGDSLKLCFRPRWYKYFDSFECDRSMPMIDLIPWDSVNELPACQTSDGGSSEAEKKAPS